MQFDLVPAVLGFMGHMMDSVMPTVPFVLVARRTTHSGPGLADLGAVYGAGVFVMMWFITLPLINPVMLQFDANTFLAAHLMWGGTNGVVVGLFSRGAQEGPCLRLFEV